MGLHAVSFYSKTYLNLQYRLRLSYLNQSVKINNIYDYVVNNVKTTDFKAKDF